MSPSNSTYPGAPCRGTKRQAAPLLPRDPNIQLPKPSIKHHRASDDLIESFKSFQIKDPLYTRRDPSKQTSQKSFDEAHDTRPTKLRRIKPSKLSTFESIPLELFDEITSHLPPRDLLRLRCVNSKIEAITRQKAFTHVLVDVIDSTNRPLSYALQNTPEHFTTVRTLSLNTEAAWFATLKRAFPSFRDADFINILFHAGAMYNLRTINFGIPCYSAFQIPDRNFVRFVRECFLSLFSGGEEGEEGGWYTRFLDVKKLSLVLPLNMPYKQPLVLQHLLNRLEQFSFYLYPNSYGAIVSNFTRWEDQMLLNLSNDFLGYLTSQLRSLTISFPTRLCGYLSLPVSAYTNIKCLTVTGYIIPNRTGEVFFSNILSLPSLQHIHLDVHIETPETGHADTTPRWSSLYKRLLSSHTVLKSFQNKAVENGGTGYACKYKVGWRDVECWKGMMYSFGFEGRMFDPVDQTRVARVEEVVKDDVYHLVLLRSWLEEVGRRASTGRRG